MSDAAVALHGDPIAPVILGVTSILAFAVLGRVGARKLGQPTVLGELLMGVLLGNLAFYYQFDLLAILREGPRVFDVVNGVLAGGDINEVAVAIFGVDKGPELVAILHGPYGGEVIQVAHAVDVFSRYGVIFLLFMVGLETDLDEMWRVGGDSIRVAVLGVVFPVALGFVCVLLLRPGETLNSTLFIAATLGATSIGVAADVLKEMGRANSLEGRIILGAAIGDDILGLIILAIVSGIVVSGAIVPFDLVFIVLLSVAFLVAAFVAGPTVIRWMATLMNRLDFVEAKMFTSYLFVMVLAWLANFAGLATIIGAFAAGIILHDGYFKDHTDADKGHVISIRRLIEPLEVILVPIFFILMGIQVKIETFMSWPVVTLAGGLLLAAAAGKILSGFGAKRPANKLAVGFGMLPRGEVGLVFAAIGRSLNVIDDSIFAAIVLMVLVTTLATPPLLKASIGRSRDQRTTN